MIEDTVVYVNDKEELLGPNQSFNSFAVADMMNRTPTPRVGNL